MDDLNDIEDILPSFTISLQIQIRQSLSESEDCPLQSLQSIVSLPLDTDDLTHSFFLVPFLFNMSLHRTETVLNGKTNLSQLMPT